MSFVLLGLKSLNVRNGFCTLSACTSIDMNKAGYTAQYAPSTRLKITRDRRTDGRTDGGTDGRTDTTSYRDATAHL